MGNNPNCNCCKRGEEDQNIEPEENENPKGSNYVKQIGENYFVDKMANIKKINPDQHLSSHNAK